MIARLAVLAALVAVATGCGGDGGLLASVAGGEVRRSRDGGTAWEPHITLG